MCVYKIYISIGYDLIKKALLAFYVFCISTYTCRRCRKFYILIEHGNIRFWARRPLVAASHIKSYRPLKVASGRMIRQTRMITIGSIWPVPTLNRLGTTWYRMRRQAAFLLKVLYFYALSKCKIAGDGGIYMARYRIHRNPTGFFYSIITNI